MSTSLKVLRHVDVSAPRIPKMHNGCCADDDGLTEIALSDQPGLLYMDIAVFQASDFNHCAP